MYIKILIISAFASFTLAYICGDPPICQCQPWSSTLVCYNVSTIPDIKASIRNEVKHFEITKTQITKLPDLSREYWPILESVTIEDNKLLNCSQVYDLELKTGHVYVSSNCLRDIDEDDLLPNLPSQINCEEKDQLPHTFLLFILMIVIGIINAAILCKIIYHKKGKIVVQNYQDCNDKWIGSVEEKNRFRLT